MKLPVTLLSRWARRVMASRKPDVIVGTAEDPYMLRWFAIPRNKWFNIYLHEFVRSDDPRALHDHPWVNLSIILEGAYDEVTIADGGIIYRHRYGAGHTRFRFPTSAHRVEVLEGVTARTLFITGPLVRTWGFHCPRGWKAWQDFVRIRTGPNGERVSEIGEGCGELQ